MNLNEDSCCSAHGYRLAAGAGLEHWLRLAFDRVAGDFGVELEYETVEAGWLGKPDRREVGIAYSSTARISALEGGEGGRGLRRAHRRRRDPWCGCALRRGAGGPSSR